MACSFRVRGGREACARGVVGPLPLPGQGLPEQREIAASGRRKQVRITLPSMVVVVRLDPPRQARTRCRKSRISSGDLVAGALQQEVAAVEEVDLGVGRRLGTRGRRRGRRSVAWPHTASRGTLLVAQALVQRRVQARWSRSRGTA